jgi:hypothetical protein
VDLDGDGLTDVLSGSWPGEMYWFRRNSDATFAAGPRGVGMVVRDNVATARRPGGSALDPGSSPSDPVVTG